LVCGNFAIFSNAFATTIPSNNNTGDFNATAPTDPTKIVSWRAYNISSGIWQTTRVSEVDLFVDGGATPNLALGVRVSYDWTGDGVWDRVEYLRAIQTDPFSGFEEFSLMATGAGLIRSTGTQYISLNNGNIELSMWSAANSGDVQMQVRTNQGSWLKIPFSQTRQQRQTAAVVGPTCQTPPNYPIAGTCNCVAFKIVQVQDFYLSSVVTDLLNVFNQTKSAVSVGIIGDSFGTNSNFVQFIRDSNRDPTWEVEIASNGYSFSGSWSPPLSATCATSTSSR